MRSPFDPIAKLLGFLGAATPRAVISVLLLAGIGALGVSPQALAQYKWVDDEGRIVYSDRPPTQARPGVMVMRGSVAVPLETVRAQASTAASSTGTDKSAASTADKPAAESPSSATPGTGTPAARAEGAAPQSLADRQLALRRRQAEAQEQERQQAAQSRQREEQAAQCEGRRTDLRTLESGGRVIQVDASGERVVVGEDEIARRIQSLRQQIAKDCSGG